MRLLRTAMHVLKDRGLIFTFWYSVRKACHILFAKQCSRMHRDLGNLPPPANVGGTPMHFHPSMIGLSENVYLYGSHEPLTTKAYLRNVHPGDHIIEVGANIGYYVLLARSVIGSSGRVLGFEPVPDIYAVLQKNVESYRNVEIFDLAVGNEIGYVEFYISEVPNWGSLVYRDNLLMKKVIKTRITRLDDFLPSLEDFQPTMIHMDIEGGEIKALEGAWQTISSYKPHLFIEFHLFVTGFGPVADVFRKLVQLGYREFVLIDRLWDEPWIPDWLRNRRRTYGSLPELINMINARSCPLCFSLFVKSQVDKNRRLTTGLKSFP